MYQNSLSYAAGSGFGGFSFGSGSYIGMQYSPLETAIVNTSIYQSSSSIGFTPAAGGISYNQEQRGYGGGAMYGGSGYNLSVQRIQAEHFDPDDFLRSNRPITQFVGDAENIKEMIEETFKIVTGKDIPKNVFINICGDEVFDMHFKRHESIAGFAINSVIKEVFVKKGRLDKVMVTLGHELGHVFTERIEDLRNEEAKAFAFCAAWCKAIKEHNIGNLAANIDFDMNPANNGIHDVAWEFVKKLLRQGKEALEIYFGIVKNHQSKTGSTL